MSSYASECHDFAYFGPLVRHRLEASRLCCKDKIQYLLNCGIGSNKVMISSDIHGPERMNPNKFGIS